jgi:hypothetical protein
MVTAHRDRAGSTAEYPICILSHGGLRRGSATRCYGTQSGRPGESETYTRKNIAPSTRRIAHLEVSHGDNVNPKDVAFLPTRLVSAPNLLFGVALNLSSKSFQSWSWTCTGIRVNCQMSTPFLRARAEPRAFSTSSVETTCLGPPWSLGKADL